MTLSTGVAHRFEMYIARCNIDIINQQLNWGPFFIGLGPTKVNRKYLGDLSKFFHRLQTGGI
jgi:hypothetical protein